MDAELRLYILIRTDLPSMQRGKSCAQACHAANQCVFEADEDEDVTADLQEWASATDRGFGTTIVLGVTKDDLYRRVTLAQRHGFHVGVVHDPTYPVRDGADTHLVPCDTCAYVFGPKASLGHILDGLELLP